MKLVMAAIALAGLVLWRTLDWINGWAAIILSLALAGAVFNVYWCWQAVVDRRLLRRSGLNGALQSENKSQIIKRLLTACSAVLIFGVFAPTLLDPEWRAAHREWFVWYNRLTIVGIVGLLAFLGAVHVREYERLRRRD